jgi:hypothetical protein
LRPTYRRCFVEIAGCLENRRWHVDRSPEIARRTVIPVVRNRGPVPDLVPRLRRRKTRQIRSRLGRVRPIMLQHGGPTREWANTVIAVILPITQLNHFVGASRKVSEGYEIWGVITGSVFLNRLRWRRYQGTGQITAGRAGSGPRVVLFRVGLIHR